MHNSLYLRAAVRGLPSLSLNVEYQAIWNFSSYCARIWSIAELSTDLCVVHVWMV